MSSRRDFFPDRVSRGNDAKKRQTSGAGNEGDVPGRCIRSSLPIGCLDQAEYFYLAGVNGMHMQGTGRMDGGVWGAVEEFRREVILPYLNHPISLWK